MLPVWVVVSVARQLDSPADNSYVAVRFEKAFKNRQNAQTYYEKLNKSFNEVIQTPSGPIECFVKRDIQEIVVEDLI